MKRVLVWTCVCAVVFATLVGIGLGGVIGESLGTHIGRLLGRAIFSDPVGLEGDNPELWCKFLASNQEPQMVDAETRLDEIYCEGTTVVYRYLLIGRRIEDMDFDHFDEIMTQRIGTTYCSQMTQVVREGVGVQWSYWDMHGKPITSIKFLPSDC